ncbi:uncharacterized protein METZ01_LOCUS95257, partial [marine metagenome]
MKFENSCVFCGYGPELWGLKYAAHCVLNYSRMAEHDY